MDNKFNIQDLIKKLYKDNNKEYDKSTDIAVRNLIGATYKNYDIIKYEMPIGSIFENDNKLFMIINCQYDDRIVGRDWAYFDFIEITINDITEFINTDIQIDINKLSTKFTKERVYNLYSFDQKVYKFCGLIPFKEKKDIIFIIVALVCEYTLVYLLGCIYFLFL